MKKESAYDFQKRLLTVHTPNLRDPMHAAKAGEYQLPDTITISMPQNASEVVQTAAEDFADYLKTSMGIMAETAYDCENAQIKVSLASESGVDLGECASYKGFRIDAVRAGVRHLTKYIVKV